jgi:hypothetical protein
VCVCVSVQVCCFMVGFFGFLLLGLIIFGLLDTRRWMKSKNTLRLMLIHHHQKATEVIHIIHVSFSYSGAYVMYLPEKS